MEQVNYDYRNFADNIDPTERDRTVVASQLGCRIHADYQSGARMTPMQKKRLAVVTAVALGVLATVGIIVAAVTVAWPIVFIAIPLVVGVVYGIYWHVSSIDIDNPQERTALIQDLASKSLSELLESHDKDTILGYSLLQGVSRRYSRDTAERQKIFYARFNHIADAFAQVHASATADTRTARATYRQQCAPFRLRRDAALGQVAQRQVAVHQVNMAVNMMSRRRNALTDGLTSVHDVYSYGQRERIEGEYCAETRAFRNEFERKRGLIRQARDNAVSLLEEQYTVARAAARA